MKEIRFKGFMFSWSKFSSNYGGKNKFADFFKSASANLWIGPIRYFIDFRFLKNKEVMQGEERTVEISVMFKAKFYRHLRFKFFWSYGDYVPDRFFGE